MQDSERKLYVYQNWAALIFGGLFSLHACFRLIKIIASEDPEFRMGNYGVTFYGTPALIMQAIMLAITLGLALYGYVGVRRQFRDF